jgi:hypothetical protein
MSSADTDPFEEFEFKPLTEGLGFHKARNGGNTISPKVPSKMDSNKPEIYPPLRRSQQATEVQNLKTPPVSSHRVDEILKNLKFQKAPEILESKSPLPKTKAQLVTPDFSAILLDSMLILALFLASLIIMLFVTKVDLLANLLQPDPEKMVYWATLSLLGSVAWTYLVTTRIFLNATPGEWVFDQQLGKPDETKNVFYGFRIALRTTIIILSGFILFPVVSWALNKDILGQWLGAQLIQQQR